jgi:osmoprotectant transport system permease protein
MNFITDGFAYLVEPDNWAGYDGVGVYMLQHVLFSLVVLAIAAVIAIPAGYLIGHTGRGRLLVVALSGGVRALPTLGLLILLALWLGIGVEAPLIALVVLAIPSILAGAYAGFEAIDRQTIDAARASGMTHWQIVTQVEIPLGLPLLMGGIRSASLQVIATATLADYVGGGGLGHYIFLGLQTSDYTLIVAGSVLVIALALVSEALFSILERLVVPAGVRAGRVRTDSRARSSRSRTVVGS